MTVFGATGAQGGGLVRAIIADKNSGFKVRAVTRNANSDKAKALEQLGAEVVVADIDDATSIKKTLEGAYGAYFVTFFWEHFSAEKEYQEVANFVSAAKDANLQHIIWSTLEDTRNWVPLDDDRMPTLQGKYKVPHFDGKGAAEDIAKCSYGIFKNGIDTVGKTIGIVGEKLSGNDMAEKFSSAMGINVIYNNVTPEMYRNFGFPGADDLGNMFLIW